MQIFDDSIIILVSSLTAISMMILSFFSLKKIISDIYFPTDFKPKLAKQINLNGYICKPNKNKLNGT